MTVIDDATCRFQLSFSSAFSVSHAPASTPSTVAGSELYPLTPPYPTHPTTTTTTTSSAFSEPPPPNLIVIIFYFLNKSFLQVILNITLLVIPKTKKCGQCRSSSATRGGGGGVPPIEWRIIAKKEEGKEKRGKNEKGVQNGPPCTSHNQKPSKFALQF